MTLESTVEFACGQPLTKRHADSHTDGAKKLCSLCSKDGDLLWVKHLLSGSLIIICF